MDKQLWNEIVIEYEKNLDTLETARREYGNAVKKIIDHLTLRFNEEKDEDAILRHGQEGGNEAWEKYFFTDIKIDEIIWCRTVARVARPWCKCEGVFGELHIAIEYKTPSPLNLLKFYRDTVKQVTSSIDGWHKESTEEISEFDNTEEWIYLDVVDLQQPDAYSAISITYEKTLKLAITLASRLRDQLQPLPKFEKAIHRCSATINDVSFPSKFPNPHFYDWNRMRIIQINFEIPFWVGYHVDDQIIMYGHNKAENKFSGLEESFSKKIGCQNTTYENYPAGVLMERTVLQNSSETNIHDTVINCFKTYAETLKGYT